MSKAWHESEKRWMWMGYWKIGVCLGKRCAVTDWLLLRNERKGKNHVVTVLWKCTRGVNASKTECHKSHVNFGRLICKHNARQFYGLLAAYCCCCCFQSLTPSPPTSFHLLSFRLHSIRFVSNLWIHLFRIDSFVSRMKIFYSAIRKFRTIIYNT